MGAGRQLIQMHHEASYHWGRLSQSWKLWGPVQTAQQAQGPTQGQRAGLNTYPPWLRAAPRVAWEGFILALRGPWVERNVQLIGWKGTGCTVVLGAQDLKTDTPSPYGINEKSEAPKPAEEKAVSCLPCPIPPSSQYLGFRE